MLSYWATAEMRKGWNIPNLPCQPEHPSKYMQISKVDETVEETITTLRDSAPNIASDITSNTAAAELSKSAIKLLLDYTILFSWN